MANILVYTEQRGGVFKAATLQAVTVAKQIVEKDGGSFSMVVLGSGVDKVAAEAARLGAAKVLVADAAALEHPVPDVYATAVAEIAKGMGATHVIANATTIAKDFLPRVAVKLGAGMVSEVTSVVGPKTFKRLMWAGNVVATAQVNTDVVVASVRGAEFDKAAPAGGSSPIEAATATATIGKCEFITFVPAVSDRPQLTDANVVVAGGRGLKNAENFENLLGALCDLMGGALGATRAAVDSGWVDNDLQIGQTGKIVAPDLYFGIGLSGAIQHLAGMKNAKVIVAINKDEEAPIFSVADYGLVDDLFKTIEPLIAAIKAQKSA
jgi:electron transfer flavoprotein alpha subunit